MSRPIAGRKKAMTTLYLEPEHLDAMNKLADRMHVPTAVLFRVGAEAVLNVERLTGEAPTYETIRNVLGLNALPPAEHLSVPAAFVKPPRPQWVAPSVASVPVPPSPRQAEVLAYIARSIGERGYAPTHREIAAECHYVSTNAVLDVLRALEHKGWIERDEGVSRGIRLLHRPAGAA